MATIKDVARHAGVAISTASAALNRSAPVSEDVLARVAEAVRATGYVPHGAARSLRSGRSQLIGLVVPNIANPHFAAVAREVENVCLARGYTSVVYSTGQDADRESQVLTMMRLQRVAGLILIPTRSDAAHGAALIDQIHVPTVLLDMFVEGLPYDVIKTDNVEAGRLATEHLLSLGHRRVGMIVGIPGLATSDDRHAGYLKAHRDRGLEPDPALVAAGHFSQDGAYEATQQLLGRTSPPTAFVAASNMTMMGLLFAARRLGLRIPADLSVVGIDELEFSEILEPRPTVVATPIIDMAHRAIELLVDQLETGRNRPADRQVWTPSLIVRESTAAVSST